MMRTPSERRSRRSLTGEVVTVGLVLLYVPACAETDGDAPAAEVVDGGQRLGEQGGVAVVHAKHQAAEARARGLDRQRRHQRHRLVGGAGVVAVWGLVEVVPDRYPVETLGVAVAPELSQLVQFDVLLSGVHAKLNLRHREVFLVAGQRSARGGEQCNSSRTSLRHRAGGPVIGGRFRPVRASAWPGRPGRRLCTAGS